MGPFYELNILAVGKLLLGLGLVVLHGNLGEGHPIDKMGLDLY